MAAAVCFAAPTIVAGQTNASTGPISISDIELTDDGQVRLRYEVEGESDTLELPQALLTGLVRQFSLSPIPTASETASAKTGGGSPVRANGAKRRVATAFSKATGEEFFMEFLADSIVTFQYLDAGLTKSFVLPVDVLVMAFRHHEVSSTKMATETQMYIEPGTGAFWLTISRGFNYKVVALIFAALLAAIVFTTVHAFTRRIRRERDDLRASRRRMMRIREAERSHLASELHDGPVQDVQRILRSNLSSLARVIPTSDSDDLSELESTLRQIAGNLRDICTDLKPPVLAHFGLEKAAESVTRSFQLRNPDITVETQFSLGPDDLSEESRLVLYRILQEALNNIEKHADASTVRVDLTIRDDEVQLIVEDDGRGFRPSRRLARLEERGHFGLSGMRQRVDSVGGTLYVDSAVGNGTRITVLVPAYSNEDIGLPISERIL
ncbi:MAG: sensor histidine kinase [Rhodothermia bacterium]|nr:sensor histidine kinase [Rhodothermia bacterium]